MPKVELYLDEADRMVRKGDFDEAMMWLGRHLEEHGYSEESKREVSWRIRDISERQMERREFPRAFDYYDSYLGLAKSFLSPEEYRAAVDFAVEKCRWIIDVQTRSNSFDIACKYFDRILTYGIQLSDTGKYDGILSYIVDKYIEEMKRKVSDPNVLEKLRQEADKYIGMITDGKLRHDFINKKVACDDHTDIY